MRGSSVEARHNVSIRANASIPDLKKCIKMELPELGSIPEEHINLYRVNGGESELHETLDKMNEGTFLTSALVLCDAFMHIPILEPYQVIIQVVDGPSKIIVWHHVCHIMLTT